MAQVSSPLSIPLRKCRCATEQVLTPNSYRNVTKLHHMNEDHLERVKSRLDDYCRHRRLEEVYVLAEVEWLKRQEIVKKAIEERGLQIHAFVYDKAKNACVRLVEEKEEN